MGNVVEKKSAAHLDTLIIHIYYILSNYNCVYKLNARHTVNLITQSIAAAEELITHHAGCKIYIQYLILQLYRRSERGDSLARNLTPGIGQAPLGNFGGDIRAREEIL